MDKRIVLYVCLTAALFVSPAQAEVEGSKIYKSKCQSCHGKKGEGNPVIARALKIPPELLPLTGIAVKTDEEVMKIIAEGKDRMPGFQEKLSPEELQAVLQHCRVLVPAKTEE